MRSNYVGLVLFVFLALATGWIVPYIGLADTVTLQQGVNGYSGCSDTLIATGAYPDNGSQNFGSCPELRVGCAHYASW